MTQSAEMVVLDTETTGWSPKNGDRVIEIAAARFDPQTGELGERFHEYVNPGFPIEEQATAVHGITNEMVADKPPFEEIADALAEFVAGTCVVIHNAPFDVGFLNHEMKVAKRPVFADLPTEIVCSRRLARTVLPPGQSAKLDNLCDLFGVDRSVRTLHGALIDCSLLAQVYPYLLERKAEQDAVLAALLPFAPGIPLPKDKDQLGRGYTVIGQLINRLKAEQDRIRDTLEPMLDGQDYEHRDFTVTFGSQTTTDWKKVQKDFLQGIDLTPYQKKSPRMTIRGT